jgi:hypothetical protein
MDKQKMDKQKLQSVMEKLEQAAEEALRWDSSFHLALQGLKSEIDHDPLVQSVMVELQAAGQRVSDSFVPRVNVRIKTDEGVITAGTRPVDSSAIRAASVDRLTLQLRTAAGAVIKNSRYCDELGVIVNEAVGSSQYFEEIAEEIESAGYRVLICLDLSSYAQIEEARAPHQPVPVRGERPDPIEICAMQLSEKDRLFLKGIGIRLDDDRPGAAISAE